MGKIKYTIKKYKLYYHPIKNEKLQKKRKRNQKKKRITELSKKQYSGFLICFDTIVIYLNNAKRYIFTGIDSASKVAFVWMPTARWISKRRGAGPSSRACRRRSNSSNNLCPSGTRAMLRSGPTRSRSTNPSSLRAESTGAERLS